VTSTLVAAVVGDHDFPTPDGTVVTVSGAIEGEPDDRLVAEVSVLRHRRSDVSVMVLNHDQTAFAGM
jgi:hypothetical protein